MHNIKARLCQAEGKLLFQRLRVQSVQIQIALLFNLHFLRLYKALRDKFIDESLGVFDLKETHAGDIIFLEVALDFENPQNPRMIFRHRLIYDVQ
jgi:hypothetical protein